MRQACEVFGHLVVVVEKDLKKRCRQNTLVRGTAKALRKKDKYA